MKTRIMLALAAALLAAPAAADTWIRNVNGIQIGPDGTLQHFAGLLIDDRGRVKQLSTAPPSMPITGTDTVGVIDGRGRTLLPGLIDAHGHVIDLGFAALRLDVTGTASLAELQQRLRDYAAAHPEAKWIQGFGWNQELWPEKRFPTAADLDAIVRDRPVVLERVDGHAYVVNSASMKAAGVTAATPAPHGGEIHDGVFVDAAKQLIDEAIPKPTNAQLDEALAKSQGILLGVGVTGVGSMSTSIPDWQAFRRAGEAGRLNVRLMAYITAAQAAEADMRPTGWLYGDRLRAVGVKLFADGALGSRTALMLEPYDGEPTNRGVAVLTRA